MRPGRALAADAQRRVGDEDERRVGDARDRGEVPDGIVGQRFPQARIDAVRRAREQQRVAVGGRPGGDLRRDDLAAAAAIVHHDLLMQRFAELRAEDPPEDVAGAGGRIRDDQPDRPLWIRFGGEADGLTCAGANSRQQHCRNAD